MSVLIDRSAAADTVATLARSSAGNNGWPRGTTTGVSPQLASPAPPTAEQRTPPPHTCAGTPTSPCVRQSGISPADVRPYLQPRFKQCSAVIFQLELGLVHRDVTFGSAQTGGDSGCLFSDVRSRGAPLKRRHAPVISSPPTDQCIES